MMKCPDPQCRYPARVLETRSRPDASVRRRYQCSAPHAKRFTTTERYEDQQESADVRGTHEHHSQGSLDD